MLLAATTNINGQSYKLDALPDPADFRDYLFTPTLVDAPLYTDLDAYLSLGVPVRNQGSEGSCIGFALSTVAHYLLRTRPVEPSTVVVSARMFYEMAKRYDEWEGEEYEGSSARGAMKGWQKHGVCSEDLWPYTDQEDDRVLTTERAEDALNRPLGAYFRVNPRDLTAMHSALAEVGVLFASATIHNGWATPDADGRITYQSGTVGGHAFAIIGYNQEGFWIQNSWGEQWGQGGCGLVTYDDWLLNALDVWVARLGVPVHVTRSDAKARINTNALLDPRALGLRKIRSHLISVHHDGGLNQYGAYATFEEDIARIFDEGFPGETERWQRRRLLIYAGGGLTSERDSVDRMSRIGAQLLQAQIYPLAFHWNSGFLGVMRTIVHAALGRLSPPPEEQAPTKKFMKDRLDGALEPYVRDLAGKLLWDDVKAIGYRATKNEAGAARIMLKHLVRFLDANPDVEVHLLAHSAGSVFLAPLVQLMTTPADQKIESGPMKGRTGYGVNLDTCTLWAPAASMDLFSECYLPAIEREDVSRGGIGRFALYTLTDEAERRDCCIGEYNKSLLYLISNALEEMRYVPMRRSHGQPLLGLEVCVEGNDALQALFAGGRADWVRAPNDHDKNSLDASRTTTHLRFEEVYTLRSTVLRIFQAGQEGTTSGGA